MPAKAPLQVVEAQTLQVLASFPPGQGGLLRGLTPALAQDRRIRRVDQDEPYLLMRREDGAPVLVDHVTGVEIDLEAFGPGTLAVVAGLIPPATPSPEES